MATLTFDTYKAVSTLQERGFTKSQAESVVTVLQTADLANVATSSDLAKIKDALIDMERAIQATRIEMYKVAAAQTVVIVGAVAALLQVL